jgi:hypothetical protein
MITLTILQLNKSGSAVQGGADRLEICGSLGLGGGITPSYGLVYAILKRFPDVPLMVSSSLAYRGISCVINVGHSDGLGHDSASLWRFRVLR